MALLTRRNNVDVIALVGCLFALAFIGWNDGLSARSVSFLTFYWLAAWLLVRAMVVSDRGAAILLVFFGFWPGFWPALFFEIGARDYLSRSTAAIFLATGCLFFARRKRSTEVAWLALLALFLALQWRPDYFFAAIPLCLLWGRVAIRLYPPSPARPWHDWSPRIVGALVGLGAIGLGYGVGSFPLRAIPMSVPLAPSPALRDAFFYQGWFVLSLLLAATGAHLVRARADRWTGSVLAVLASGLIEFWLRMHATSLSTPVVLLWPGLAGLIGVGLLLRAPEG